MEKEKNQEKKKKRKEKKRIKEKKRKEKIREKEKKEKKKKKKKKKNKQVTVDIKDLISLNLELPQTIRGNSTITKRGIVLVRPRRTVRVTITVVVAQQIVAVSGLVGGDLERLINSREKMLAKIRDQIDQVGEVILNVSGRHTPHQVKGTVKLVSHCVI